MECENCEETKATKRCAECGSYYCDECSEIDNGYCSICAPPIVTFGKYRAIKRKRNRTKASREKL